MNTHLGFLCAVWKRFSVSAHQIQDGQGGPASQSDEGGEEGSADHGHEADPNQAPQRGQGRQAAQRNDHSGQGRPSNVDIRCIFQREFGFREKNICRNDWTTSWCPCNPCPRRAQLQNQPFANPWRHQYRHRRSRWRRPGRPSSSSTPGDLCATSRAPSTTTSGYFLLTNDKMRKFAHEHCRRCPSTSTGQWWTAAWSRTWSRTSWWRTGTRRAWTRPSPRRSTSSTRWRRSPSSSTSTPTSSSSTTRTSPVRLPLPHFRLGTRQLCYLSDFDLIHDCLRLSPVILDEQGLKALKSQFAKWAETRTFIFLGHQLSTTLVILRQPGFFLSFWRLLA